MCTNIGATGLAASPGGGTWIGGVSDDPYDIRTTVVVRRPEEGFAYIGTHLAPLAASASDQEYSDSVSGAPTRALNEAGSVSPGRLRSRSRRTRRLRAPSSLTISGIP